MTGPHDWVPNRDVADSSLVVEALLPQIRRRSRRPWDIAMRILGARAQGRGMVRGSAGTEASQASSMARYVREDQDERSAPLMCAADELTSRLTPDELVALRERGELPDWFLPAVMERARDIKRQMRG